MSRLLRVLLILAATLGLVLPCATAEQPDRPADPEAAPIPTQIPPRRSSQIHDGFGINSDLPRDPYLPWNRWWWTRMFDAGVKWIRIGQYENSSDQTSWDWIERKRGVMEVPPELDDYVDSLAGNGVDIQVQLLYGNPMYTSPAGRLPDSITPEPGSFHNPDRSLYSVYWPPKTPDQIDAFIRYVKFMVNHFRGRVHYWALWNEQDIDYWNPEPNPEDYGRLLKAFVPAVHETDPGARVIYGGQAWPLSRDFTRRALATCQCASGIDVFAYHIYPAYGHNLNPEAVDDPAHAAGGGKLERELIRQTPGVRPDVEFWCDEFNSIPTWTNMDDSVQVKYVPRQLVYNWAAGVKTFVWLLTAGTDGNEYDDFGLIHGLRYLPDDFTPRPVYAALAHTNWLFSDTRPDDSIKLSSPDFDAISGRAGGQVVTYGFRSRSGKPIVAYWLAVRSQPGNHFPTYTADVRLEASGIHRPVLIDVDSGSVTALTWKNQSAGELGPVPMRDSVTAIADADYFDWSTLPEAPSSLTVINERNRPRLSWELHGGNLSNVLIERRVDGEAAGPGDPNAPESWQRIATLESRASSYTDSKLPDGAHASYRVRALNSSGESAYSNVVRWP